MFSLSSQDVFVPTQSQEAPQQSEKKTESQSQRLDSAPFSLPLQLSVNTESNSPAQQTPQHQEEDSQATQIEDLEEPPGADTSDSVTSHSDQRSKSNGVPPESQTATSSKASTSSETAKHRSECAKDEQSKTNPSQKSDLHKTTSLNVQNVNVKDTKEASSADVVSCSQPKFDSSDLTVNSCVQETLSDTTPCSLPSQSMISQTSAVDVVKSSVDSRAKSQSVESSSQKCGAVGNSQRVKDMMDERDQGEAEEEEEEEVMEEEEEEEEENTVGGRASGMALLLSQSQLLSPEPMEEDSEDRGEDSVIVVTDSERDSQILQKDVTPQSKANSSQPIRDKVTASTNGHESQAQVKKVHVDSDRLSQTEKTGPEPEGLKDKSLSDSSGGKLDIGGVTVISTTQLEAVDPLDPVHEIMRGVMWVGLPPTIMFTIAYSDDYFTIYKVIVWSLNVKNSIFDLSKSTTKLKEVDLCSQLFLEIHSVVFLKSGRPTKQQTNKQNDIGDNKTQVRVLFTVVFSS